MPRKPDPELETRIIDAALRLLDRGGEGAVTMRAVAEEAGTSTPSIYERFPDRVAVLRGVAQRATEELYLRLREFDAVEKFAREYLRFSCDHPLRFDLTVETFGERSVVGEARPVFELLKSRLTSEVGITGSKCDDLALAIASLFIGTARGMVAAGTQTRHANELRRASLAALEHLLKAFSDDGGGEKRSA